MIARLLKWFAGFSLGFEEAHMGKFPKWWHWFRGGLDASEIISVPEHACFKETFQSLSVRLVAIVNHFYTKCMKIYIFFIYASLTFESSGL